jgi:hypothetical protein
MVKSDDADFDKNNYNNDDGGDDNDDDDNISMSLNFRCFRKDL